MTGSTVRPERALGAPVSRETALGCAVLTSARTARGSRAHRTAPHAALHCAPCTRSSRVPSWRSVAHAGVAAGSPLSARRISERPGPPQVPCRRGAKPSSGPDRFHVKRARTASGRRLAAIRRPKHTPPARRMACRPTGPLLLSRADTTHQAPADRARSPRPPGRPVVMPPGPGRLGIPTARLGSTTRPVERQHAQERPPSRVTAPVPRETSSSRRTTSRAAPARSSSPRLLRR
jgi:hypothetical protein